jgi:hypothetical protein
MCMVRSPKSIGGAVGATLGNAPYKIIGDRTRRIHVRKRTWGMSIQANDASYPLDCDYQTKLSTKFASAEFPGAG